MRVAEIVEDSIVDGEGMRFVVFTQGCYRNCRDCHNPQTHDVNGGYEVSVQELVERIERNPLCSGLTLSGGEPFLQAAECAELAQRVKALELNVWAYTGYTLDELENVPNSAELLTYTDVLVDGRFVAAQKSYTAKWRGSSNQCIWRKQNDRWIETSA